MGVRFDAIDPRYGASLDLRASHSLFRLTTERKSR
jgi:hypothetical protein